MGRMERQRVTLIDLAEHCGVSVGTVSRALAGDPLIKQGTRDRIIAAADRLGYVPNEMARSLQKRFNRIIGLLIPDIMNPFFSQVAKATEEYARRHDYSVFLCNTNLDADTEKNYIRQLYSYRVAGIIILPVSPDLDSFIGQYFPPEQVVYISYKPSGEDANYIITDDAAIMRLAIDHLTAMGHARIAYLGGHENLFTSVSRHRCFVEALEQRGLSPAMLPGGVKHYRQGTIDDLEKDLLAAERLPTAFVCYNDRLAIDLLGALETIGLRVPGDVSVIGIDDSFISGLPHLNLTTVSQPKEEMGEKAAATIINNASHRKADFRHVILTPSLVVRGSVGEALANI